MRTAMMLVLALLLTAPGTVRAQIAPDSPTAALFDSVIANDLAGVQASLDAGADVSARDRYGNTAADVAVDRGHFDIAHYLLGVAQRQRELAQQKAAEPAAETSPSPPDLQPAPPPAAAPPAPAAEPEPARQSAPEPFTGPSPFDVEVPRTALPVVTPAPVSAPVSAPELPPASDPLVAEPVEAPAAASSTAAVPEPAPVAEVERPEPELAQPVEPPVEATVAAPSEAPEASPVPSQGEDAGASSFMSDFLSFILPDKTQPAVAEATRAPVQDAAEPAPAAPVAAVPVPETNRTFGPVLGMELGTARSAQHFQSATSCAQKTPELAVCIEPVTWPAGVLANDAAIDSGVYRRTVGDQRLRAVVGYENGTAAYVHTIVAAADFDAAVAHLSALFGAPDARAERVAAPLGKPRSVNRVYTWFGTDGQSGKRMRVEIMNFDDVRDIFPKMGEAAIVIRYDGAKPAFAYVTPVELIGLF